MDFNSLACLGYLTATAVVYHLAPRNLRARVLLLSSYIFYYVNSHDLVLLLLGDTVLVFSAGLLLQRAGIRRKRLAIIWTAAVILIGSLVLFKGAYLLRGTWIAGIVLPLGVSFYTFKLLGYLIDVYWKASEAEEDYVAFAAYVSFFPQIVAGPIQRSEQFLPQIHRPTGTNREMVLLGCQRILLGLFKKFLVADNLGVLVDFIYQHLHTVHEPVFLAFYAYPLQMYADFSALTDISVGAALFFGIIAPENFQAPFSAASPSEYWRRWHITLTLWLTDYIFTPLRMSTRKLGDAGLVLSLTINMVLIGLWHGLFWTFGLFGVVHAVYLSIDALTMKSRRRYYKVHPRAEMLADGIGPITTFHLVAVEFVCFRAQSWRDIIFVLHHLVGTATAWDPAFTEFFTNNEHAIAIGLVGYGIVEGFDWLRRRNAETPITSLLPRWGRWSVYSCSAIAACFTVMLLVVHSAKGSPFLYAVF
jgi:alginate O-acetyltransferase complex protein AlgI